MAVTTETNVNSFMKAEFTTNNYYILSLQLEVWYKTAFIIGHNPTLDTMDGLYLFRDRIDIYDDDELVDSVHFDEYSSFYSANLKILRQGEIFSLFDGENKIYETDRISWNTIGAYSPIDQPYACIRANNFVYEPYVSTEITPPVDEYDGSIYGSNIHLEIRDDHINMTDYGMLPSGAIGGGKVIIEGVPLIANDLELELETKYNNTRFQRLENLTGEIQMRVYEDISTSDSVKEYSKVLCSPMVVPNVQTVFTRHSEEGILYYIKDPKQTKNTSPTYMCNAYTQYKGGCNIMSETGISLFNLDNAFSPIFVSNNLVRAEFHRRSGYIKLSRWDENSNDWYVVNILKLQNNPQLTLVEYNDDYCELQFGKTTWKFYRGRPFIVCNHSKDDLRILNLVDRVYCETVENERGLGFVEEHNPNLGYTTEDGTQCSVFNPQLSIQQFKQELHIGQNIRADNFELYNVDSNYLIGEPNEESLLGVVAVNDENALYVSKASGSKLALNFPSHSHYVKRVGDVFSLSIDYIDNAISSFKVKARGFDDRGCVPVRDGIQYGIWEQTKTITVDTSTTDGFKVTFTGCPTDVKYLDFIIIFDSNSSDNIVMQDFMYYQGDAPLNHSLDTSRAYAEQVEILFRETYFANLYNEDDPYGLCIIRPSQHNFSLRTIYADKETVFAPYMKKSSEWDKPSQVFLEYLNAKRQVIDIDWEN